MKHIRNPLDVIKSLGGNPTTGACRCPVPGHGKGRGDQRPSLWISPEGKGLKCKAGCSYKDVAASIRACGVEISYESKRPTLLPPINADLDEAQRFLDLLDPKAESWTFQTFDDSGEKGTRPTILHGTLAEHAVQLKKLSRYGAGIFVCPNVTDGKGRKKENITAIRVVSVDLDGSPLAPVQKCELPPHVIVETSPGRYQAHWRVDGLPLDEFVGITLGAAKRFHGDEQIAELSHTCRLVGFEHTKDPAKRFQVRIVEANERPPYTADETRKAFPSPTPAAAPAISTVLVEKRTTGGSAPLFSLSPAAKQYGAEKIGRYVNKDGAKPTPEQVEQAVGEAAKLDKVSYELVRTAFAESVGMRVGILDDIVTERREELRGVEPEPPPPDIDALRATAHDIITSRDVLGMLAEHVGQSIAGEKKLVKLLYLVGTSRLFEKAMHAAIKGASAAGKSEVRKGTLTYFPPEAIVTFTVLSEKSLLYYKEDFPHKILSMGEACGHDEAKLQDYLLRSLMSENRIDYPVAVKRSGVIETITITKHGPVAFLVTTTRNALHPENETRMLSLEVNDSEEQTRRVLQKVAEVEGYNLTPTEADLKPWHDFQRWLAAGECRVTIPFAKNSRQDAAVDAGGPLAARLRPTSPRHQGACPVAP